MFLDYTSIEYYSNIFALQLNTLIGTNFVLSEM